MMHPEASAIYPVINNEFFLENFSKKIDVSKHPNPPPMDPIPFKIPMAND